MKQTGTVIAREAKKLWLPLSYKERGLGVRSGDSGDTLLNTCLGARAQIVEHFAVYARVGGVMQQSLFQILPAAVAL